MPLRVSDKRKERILREVHDREEAKRTISGRIWPNLIKPTDEPAEETKPAPIQGWSHLRKK